MDNTVTTGPAIFQDNQSEHNKTPVKHILFRLPEDLKVDFRVALLRNRINLQNTLRAFVEEFVAFSNGQCGCNTMTSIISRAHKLMTE